MLLEAFLAALIHGAISPEITKLREKILEKVEERIRSQKNLGDRALKSPVSDFSEKDHDVIKNIFATILEEYGISKEIKNTLSESYLTVLSTESKHVIKIMNGVNRGREYILGEIDVTKDIRWGRCHVCEIQMYEKDLAASRHHGRLIFENGEYFIEDIWSRNGTTVNGQEIKVKTRLHDNDRIKIGQAMLLFSEKERLIRVIDGRGMETNYSLSKIKMREDIRMGRWSGCEIPIDKDDRTVSRHHARIAFENGKYIVEDMCSTNGTLVNGKEIKKQKLEDGDEIKLGNALMQFRNILIMG